MKPTARGRGPAAAILPSERAFVVQFAADSTEAGRAEHVVSGREIRFRSNPELQAFMRRVLDAQASGRDTHESGSDAEPS